MKKQYITPCIEVMKIESEVILAGSSTANTTLDNDNVIDNSNDIQARPFSVWDNED